MQRLSGCYLGNGIPPGEHGTCRNVTMATCWREEASLVGRNKIACLCLFFYSAGDQTQGFVHVRQMLYH